MRAIAAIGLAALTACGSIAATVARAADLDYPPPPAFSEPDAHYEFGTGWYLRGDASFGPEDQPKLTVPGLDAKKTGWGWGAGGGIGYKFNSFLRGDVTADYFDPLKSTMTAATADGLGTIAYKDSLQRYDGLANLYLDLGTWYGLTPYIGGGAGFAVFDPSQKTTTSDLGAVTVAKNHVNGQTTFAWAAMAGVSYQVDPNIAIDLGYRHLDLGRFSTTLTGYTIDKHFTRDEVRVGLRYMIE